MIKVEKIESFANCNNCGKYNMQPIHSTIFDKYILPENENDIYEYCIGYGNGGMLVRLCDKCAKDLIIQLYKQVDKK